VESAALDDQKHKQARPWQREGAQAGRRRDGVGIRPRINYIKLNEHIRRLLLSSSVRIARSKLFSFISYFPSISGVITCGTKLSQPVSHTYMQDTTD
jgi:hypothetical protein